MELFFPVHDYERDALFANRWDAAELAGLDRLEWDMSGADEDAIWVATELPEAAAAPFEDRNEISAVVRTFVLPPDVLNTLRWREVRSAEVEAARQG